MSDALIVSRTKNWLENVVIGLNFCPFARKEFVGNRIRYVVKTGARKNGQELLAELRELDENESIATTLIVYPDSLVSFEEYLDHLVDCEELLVREGYEGAYQLASFHPEYQFQGSSRDDVTNFTNRSPYPMVHILREAELTLAIDKHGDTESIPDRNQELCRSMGIVALRKLLENS